MPPATVYWLYGCSLLGIISITAICLSAGPSLGCLSASSFSLCDFPLHISSPPLSLCLPHTRSFYLSHTHAYKQGRVTTHSAVICLSRSSHSLSYTFTTGITAAQLFPSTIIPHDGETGLTTWGLFFAIN